MSKLSNVCESGHKFPNTQKCKLTDTNLNMMDVISNFPKNKEVQVKLLNKVGQNQ